MICKSDFTNGRVILTRRNSSYAVEKFGNLGCGLWAKSHRLKVWALYTVMAFKTSNQRDAFAAQYCNAFEAREIPRGVKRFLTMAKEFNGVVHV